MNRQLVILTTNGQLDQWLEAMATASRPVHFVPTMGALHRGHQALIRTAGTAGAAVLVSVFVNPAQFGADEDLERYPADQQGDIIAAEVAGADAVWFPTVQDVYGTSHPRTGSSVAPELLQSLCGPWRPGHFEGVLAVMERLLQRVRPTWLVMGEKDWQQLTVLRRDLLPSLRFGPCRLVTVPVVRESDGLPCSSRNRLLSPAQRREAARLTQVRQRVVQAVREGERCARVFTELAHTILAPVANRIDYVELVDPVTLQPCTTLQGVALFAVAVRFGDTRLIDNQFLMGRAPIVTIDGPAGAGKSTVTRRFATRAGLLYLDTGAMYRAVTWLMLERDEPVAPGPNVRRVLATMDLVLQRGVDGTQQVQVNGTDVTSDIRTSRITAAVPRVAALPEVREVLTDQQRAFGQAGGLVSEGRDMGTLVFPDADLKVYLTASVEERARRRAADMAQQGQEAPPLATLVELITERDRLDRSRPVAPLRPADDAVDLCTDGLSIDAVVDRLEDLFRQRVGRGAWPDPPAT